MFWINRLFSYLGTLLRLGRATNSKVLVLQPLPGIGDMAWHLPTLNALARRYGPLIVMTKARSLADQLLEGNPAIARIAWLERAPGRHDGAIGLLRLVADLRRLQVSEAWVLHGSARYTLALYLAGVKRIIAPGKGLQKLFSDPGMWLPKRQLKTHPIQRAEHMLKHAAIPLAQHEGCLKAPEKYLAQIKQNYPRTNPVILGIGSSEPYKQWGAESFSQLARHLLEHDFQVVLVGGRTEQSLAAEIIDLTKEPGLRLEIAKPLPYLTALLSISKAYVGNDTGVLNMALACGIPTFGLFGGSTPLTHATNLHAIEPDHPEQGMAGITAKQVFDELAQTLNIEQ